MRMQWIGALLERRGALVMAVVAITICLPFSNSVWLLADEGIWLHAAQRMLDGQTVYRDFFEFHPPLAFLAISRWLEIFGTSLFAARMLVIMAIALTAGLSFSFCKLVSGRPVLSGLLTLAWLVGTQGVWTVLNHHWFTTFLTMLSMLTLLTADRGVSRFGLAGLAVCAATLVTTHRGAVLVVGAGVSVLLLKSAKGFAWFVASGLMLLACVLVYLFWHGVLFFAFEQIVLYPLQHYSKIQDVPYGAFLTPQNFLQPFAFPVAAGLLFLICWREGLHVLREVQWRILLIFSITGLVGCFPRPDAVHIGFCVPLVLPLLAAEIDCLLSRNMVTRSGSIIGSALVILPVIPLLAVMNLSIRAPSVQTAAGNVKIVTDDGTKEVISRFRDVAPADTIFFYPYDPLLPYLMGRNHPARLDILVPQYSTSDQYFEVCREVMDKADWIVFDNKISRPEFYRAVFPAMADPSPHEKVAFEEAMRAGFASASNFKGFEVLKRSQPSMALCAKVASRSSGH
jgi:hypothetical protein